MQIYGNQLLRNAYLSLDHDQTGHREKEIERTCMNSRFI